MDPQVTLTRISLLCKFTLPKSLSFFNNTQRNNPSNVERRVPISMTFWNLKSKASYYTFYFYISLSQYSYKPLSLTLGLIFVGILQLFILILSLIVLRTDLEKYLYF